MSHAHSDRATHYTIAMLACNFWMPLPLTLKDMLILSLTPKIFLSNEFQENCNNIKAYLKKEVLELTPRTTTCQAPRTTATVTPQVQMTATIPPPEGKCAAWFGTKYNKIISVSIQDYYNTFKEKRKPIPALLPNTILLSRTFSSRKSYSSLIIDVSTYKHAFIVCQTCQMTNDT